MTPQVPAAAGGADTRRHKLVGDVHLILLNPAGEVLFGQRHNTGYEDGTWHLTGHLEAGESVVAALIREAREETGIVIKEPAVEFAHVMDNSSSRGRAAFFFTFQRWAGVPENREPGKCGALKWFPLGALPEHMIGYCRSALSHVTANRAFSIYGW
jgi:8-oxo-dGTP diphosphatase